MGQTFLTPKKRLEALEVQVNEKIPADHELQRIVGDMTGIYGVLTAPPLKPKTVISGRSETVAALSWYLQPSTTPRRKPGKPFHRHSW